MGDGSRGDFFAVDRRTFALTCCQGMNAAVVYLVLARGTGRDNRTTAWSINAIEKYTGIGRGRARRALNELLREGFVCQKRCGDHPLYFLVPWHELPSQAPPPLTRPQQRIFDAIKARAPISGTDNRVALVLERAGLVKQDPTDGSYAIDHTRERPEWIWLPNSLVTGAAGETPPVERVRQTQDVMTVRLLVDLYHAQNLREDGGIGRQHCVWKYERHRVGERGEYVIWGFKLAQTWVTWNDVTDCHRRETLSPEEKKAGLNAGVDFFRRFDALGALGLIEGVPHLFESDSPEAEIIHVYGVGGSESVEDRLGAAANDAAYSMITEGQAQWAENNGLPHLAPVLRHITQVQMYGIARLRYRPRTTQTAAWWADLNEKGKRWIAKYDALALHSEAKGAVA